MNTKKAGTTNMTLDELNELVIKEAINITEDNWFNEIVQVIEKVLKDHNMIPDDMVLSWAKRSPLQKRDTVILHLPETKLAFSLFSVLTHKLPNDALVILNYVVGIFYSLLDIYTEHQDIRPVIDKAVIRLYTDKTDIETREYEERNKPL